MIIKQALAEGVRWLSNIEYCDSFFEAKLILTKLLNVDTSYLIAYDDEELSEDVKEEYFKILERRKNREPLQYILGETEFFGNRFVINQNVLIPRNDTELSIEVMDDIFKTNKIENFLEIGCGTGIVSITMALKNPNTNFECVDISEDALANARENVNLFKLNNIKVKKSDVFSNVEGKYDVIYSNPPYIKSEDIEHLQKEVKDFEPRLALDGGIDGLYFYRKIINESEKYLNKNGFLVFEIGYDQKDDLKYLLKGYRVEVYRDISNRDRVVVGSKGD